MVAPSHGTVCLSLARACSLLLPAEEAVSLTSLFMPSANEMTSQPLSRGHSLARSCSAPLTQAPPLVEYSRPLVVRIRISLIINLEYAYFICASGGCEIGCVTAPTLVLLQLPPHARAAWARKLPHVPRRPWACAGESHCCCGVLSCWVIARTRGAVRPRRTPSRPSLLCGGGRRQF